LLVRSAFWKMDQNNRCARLSCFKETPCSWYHQYNNYYWYYWI